MIINEWRSIGELYFGKYFCITMQFFPKHQTCTKWRRRKKFPWRSYPPFWIWFFLSVLLLVKTFFLYNWIQASIRGANTLSLDEFMCMFVCVCVYMDVLVKFIGLRDCMSVWMLLCWVEVNTVTIHTDNITPNRHFWPISFWIKGLLKLVLFSDRCYSFCLAKLIVKSKHLQWDTVQARVILLLLFCILVYSNII